MPNSLDYTVGWICAVTTEYVAARALLDEEHPGPENVSTHDQNDYTLGRVGKHNVVIAVLPLGEYGTSTATGVARDMLNSFPNIRVALLVGIGGGAPSDRCDIRLGDVVIGISNNGKGSVIQYDFGKAIQGKGFQQTGVLNQPPLLLRSAVNGLQAEYMAKGHKLKAVIDHALKLSPRLKKIYQRPEVHTDRLYHPQFVHKDDRIECAKGCGGHAATLVQRPIRGEADDDPAIHYGSIASANTLMKDAIIRDGIQRKWGILCFEMEAAGLMNQIPCLIIRGICDYSDSHKSKEWQGYAAMTAAAYARDLLHRLPPRRVAEEKRIMEVICDIQEDVKQLVHKSLSKDHESIIKWISTADYAPQQNDYFYRRQPGTCEWLLGTSEFRTWWTSKGQILFCPGIPGAGKTILASTVINTLQRRRADDTNIGLAYIYCNFQRKDQDITGLIASLLKQLAQDRPSLPETVKQLYDMHKANRTRPSLAELLKTLQSVVKMYSAVFIVADALDECQTTDGCRTLLISELIKLCNSQGVNLFATSRDTPNIVDKFKNCRRVEIRATNEDVRRYLKARLFQLPDFAQRDSQLQNQVITAITSAVKGMFLLAKLHFESIQAKKSPKYLRTALENLPTGSDAYDYAYQDAMKRICDQKKDQEDLAKQALSWIIYAERPLTTRELQDALAIEIGEKERDESNISDIKDIFSVCAGLVTIDRESGIIRLVHYTAQEYFNRTKANVFAGAETKITVACATYLQFDVFRAGPCPSDDALQTRLYRYPLYSYASTNWGIHARRSPFRDEILNLLRSKAKIESSIQAMLVHSFWGSASKQSQMTSLHLAAYFGAVDYVERLCYRDILNSVDAWGFTPLAYAAQNGHEGTVLLLFNKRARVESKDYPPPIGYAAQNGHDRIVRLLLERGAAMDILTHRGRTPLGYAAENGHDAVVKILLKYGAKVDMQDLCGATALVDAAANGHDNVVKTLIQYGADVNSGACSNGISVSNQGDVAGRDRLANWVLESSVSSLRAGRQKRHPPLIAAVQRDNITTVRLLLENGADANVGGRDGCSPLSEAAIYGFDAVAELLLRYGANINFQDGVEFSPLGYAALRGHEAVVHVLLKYGADLKIKDMVGRTPLDVAESKRHWNIAQLLERHGAKRAI